MQHVGRGTHQETTTDNCRDEVRFRIGFTCVESGDYCARQQEHKPYSGRRAPSKIKTKQNVKVIAGTYYTCVHVGFEHLGAQYYIVIS